MADAVPYTGEQHQLTYGDQRAVVVEVGGGLRSYTVGERAVLDGYAADEMVTGARGQVLVPWPNRVADGRYRFAGEGHQLPLDEPERRCAIHGLARWHSWRVADRADHRLTLRHVVYAQPGWPFVLEVAVTYTLGEAGLTVRTEACNLGPGPLPYGNGAHPYLTVGTHTVDEAELQVPADRYLPTDDRGIPTSVDPVDGTPYDFRSPRRIGDLAIDYAFTDLHRDGDGRARVRLAAPGGPAVALWVDGTYPYVEVFTGDTLPADKRRTGLGVEPMTCPPNAFGAGTGFVTLAPGERHRSEWGVEPLAASR